MKKPMQVLGITMIMIATLLLSGGPSVLAAPAVVKGPNWWLIGGIIAAVVTAIMYLFLLEDGEGLKGGPSRKLIYWLTRMDSGRC